MEEIIEEASCLKEVEPEKARALLERLALDELDKQSALQAGALAEELGMLSLAVGCYNRALACDPMDIPALWALAELRREQGDWRRADNLLVRLEQAGESSAAEQRVALLALNGRPEDARGVWARLDAEGRRRSAGWLEGNDYALEAGGSSRLPGVPRASAAEVIGLLDLFAGREGVHARQWCGPDGRSGYSPVRQPMTPALLRQHLAGMLTLGVYVVRHEQTCAFLAFDFDIHVQARRAARDARDFEQLLQRTLSAAKVVQSKLEGLGLASVIEASGGKGHHLWTFFKTPLPTARVRRLGMLLLGQAAPLPEGVSAEIFPAQDRVKPRGLGSLIKLPLGLHQRSGRRSYLLDDNGREISEPVGHLLGLARVGQKAFDTLWQAVEGMSAVQLQEKYDSVPDEETADNQGSSADQPRLVPTEAPYQLDADVELAFLLERCATLKSLVRKSRNGKALTHDEQAVVTYTLGNLLRGAETVNAVMQAAGHAPPLKSPLRGNPMSCRKIRARLDIDPADAGCVCVFDATLGSYQHPLLHLSALLAQKNLAAGDSRGLAGDEQLRLEREIARLTTMRRQLDAAAAGAATGTDCAAGCANQAKIIPFPEVNEKPGDS